MRGFFHFLGYNNAVPIAISFLLLGAGGAFAATNPGAILSSTSTVESIDNSFIINRDLPSWDFKVQVVNVTQDDDTYYVAYTYEDIQLVDSVWQEVTVKGVLKASKKETDQSGIDLGVFVAKQLSDLMKQVRAVLVDAQKIEKGRGESQKVVATLYSGLIGKFLGSSEETFDGYTPVIQPLPTDDELAAAADAISRTDNEAEAHIPTQEEIDAVVAQRVHDIIADGIATSTDPTLIDETATSTDDTASSTPPDVVPGNTTPPTSDSADTGTTTPPTDTGTTTPPTDTGGGGTGTTTPPTDTGTTTPPTSGSGDTGTTTPPTDTGTTTPPTDTGGGTTTPPADPPPTPPPADPPPPSDTPPTTP